jgi:DNA-binding Xre family transcriptional regulator
LIRRRVRTIIEGIMVLLKVRELAEKRGITNPLALSKRSGLAYANCWKIWHDQQTRIDLTTIDRLCEALDCEPGDFLVYVKVKRIPSKK